ncbi:MAG: TadE family protein [Acidobacteriota bacterium]
MKRKLNQIDRSDCQTALATGLNESHISGALTDNNQRRLRERGQSMVEMAFILPLFLALVFSIIEIGRAWYTKQTLTLAAREGARVLVLPHGAGLTFSTEGEQQQAAVNTVKSYLQNSGVVVANDTQIVPIRLGPGPDNILDTADDKSELNYSSAIRGDRIGIKLRHTFDSPLGAILTMFSNDHGAAGASDAGTPGQIRMGVTCYLEHE